MRKERVNTESRDSICTISCSLPSLPSLPSPPTAPTPSPPPPSLAGRTNEDGTQEYQCKWRGLPYSECTWEDGNLVSNWFQEEIDAFIERNGSDCIPNKNSKVLRHRPRFIYMKEQHKSLGKDGKFQLRDYQLEGVNWLIKSWCK